MRFWFTRSSDVRIREQIVTQVVLGILCSDLKTGQRLPSTRELARRFRIHPNTVSGAYRQLQRDRWVEFRRGSGVYVSKSKAERAPSPTLALDQLTANLVRSAREMGIPLAVLQSHFRRWMAVRPPDHFLLIEPDEDLLRIVVAEMRRAVKLPVVGRGLEACGNEDDLAGAIPVALPNKAERVRKALPPAMELIALELRSVPDSLHKWLPAPSNALLAIASCWPGFLQAARTMLVAAGFDPDSLVFLDAREKRWQRALKQTAAVICDAVTAEEAPQACRVISFPLLSETAIQELKRCEEFAANPYLAQL